MGDTYLCTESDIETKSHTFECADGMDYYSYTNMINPMPCAEILISAGYEMYPTSVQIPVSPWKPVESFNSCMESYIGSISAYFGIYMASDLVDLRGNELERDPLDVGIFYAAWGLMWIHSSYANYCIGSYGNLPAGSGIVASAMYDGLTTAESMINIAKTMWDEQSETVPDFMITAMTTRIENA